MKHKAKKQIHFFNNGLILVVLLFILACFFLSGCETAPYVVSSVGAGSSTFSYVQTQSCEQIFPKSYNHVWNATLGTLKDLSFSYKYKKMEEEDEELLASSLSEKTKLTISLRKVSENLTRVKIKAKKGWIRSDRALARVILSEIDKRLKKQKDFSLTAYGEKDKK